MTKKHVGWVAIIMIVIFAATVIIYPQIFSTADKAATPDLPPAELELNK